MQFKSTFKMHSFNNCLCEQRQIIMNASKFVKLILSFNKAALHKQIDPISSDKLFILPDLKRLTSNLTLNFYEKSRLTFGHAETVIYFAKKFRIPCRFLQSREREMVSFYIDFGSTASARESDRKNHEWDYYSPIVVDTYASTMISPVVPIPVSDGCIFNTLSFTVSSFVECIKINIQ